MSQSDLSTESTEVIAPSPTAGLLTLTQRCFFKNAVVYRLPVDFKLTARELEEKLTANRLTALGAFDAEKSGWINSSPLGRTVHTANGQHLIALGHHKKILPASMIKQEVEKRCALIADEQGAPVGRKQKRKIKDEVRTELMAKAMIRTTTTRAWLDTEGGWLAVEAAGVPRAEKFVTELRNALDTFAVVWLEPKETPGFTMAAWLRVDEATDNLTLDTDLELQSIKDGATVKYSRHALDGADIKKHLDEGKVVTKLGLTWNDRIAFVLTSKLELKRLSFLSLLEESEDDADEKSEIDQFDADLTIMSDDLSQMLEDLCKALGVSIDGAAPKV